MVLSPMTATAEVGAGEEAEFFAALPLPLAESPVAAVHAKAALAQIAAARVVIRLQQSRMKPPLRRCGFSWNRRRFYSRNALR